MFELKKWEPFRELSTIQREMDDLFRKTFSGLSSGIFGREFKGKWSLDVDCYTKDGKLMVHADIPGIDPKNVDISITGNLLTIKAERKSVVDEKKGDYIFHETSCGIFERTVILPEGVDTDHVHASYKNGVIVLSMPVKEGAIPKKIKVELEGTGKKAA